MSNEVLEALGSGVPMGSEPQIGVSLLWVEGGKILIHSWGKLGDGRLSHLTPGFVSDAWLRGCALLKGKEWRAGETFQEGRA